jgi:hypothetical protein
MPQLFRPAANTIARVILLSVLIAPFATIGAAYAVLRSPFVTGQAQVHYQPVPFSHLHHVGEMRIDCRYCHTSVETSAFAGMPPTKTCMTCHSQLFTNAAMLKPVRDSLAENKPLHWTRIYRLPDYVYFDHSVHVNNGIGCSTCHGRVDRMPLMLQAVPLTMGWCLDCHRDPKPALRPPDKIFDMAWQPPPDQTQRAPHLLAAYHISTEHLTDCSRCHR